MSKLHKLIIVISAVVVACLGLSKEQKERAEVHYKVCIQKIGVKSEEVDKVLGGDFSAADSKIQCFAKCFFEESGLMNAEGDFMDGVAIENLSATVNRAKVEALVNTCKLQIGNDSCETAFKIYKCYAEHNAL